MVDSTISRREGHVGRRSASAIATLASTNLVESTI